VTGAVALLLQEYPQLTPDQVKQMLIQSTTRLRGAPPFAQGNGELDLNKLLTASTPSSTSPSPTAMASATQWSTGLGSLELSRGDAHLTNDGVVLQGDETIFGLPFDSAAMAALEAADDSWSGGNWDGSTWTGDSWNGSSWSGSSWSGSSWSGSSWSGSSWSGNSWSGSSWSGSSWSGSSWSSLSWSGSSWSGDGWLGASWG
jgi:serine protease AprX